MISYHAGVNYATVKHEKLGLRRDRIAIIGGASISWFSRMQLVIAMSSTEPEYDTGRDGKGGVIPTPSAALDGTMKSRGQDNHSRRQRNGTEAMVVTNPISSNRTKYIDMRHHLPTYIQGLV